jgi:hypothetical protein
MGTSPAVDFTSEGAERSNAPGLPGHMARQVRHDMATCRPQCWIDKDLRSDKL